MEDNNDDGEIHDDRPAEDNIYDGEIHDDDDRPAEGNNDDGEIHDDDDRPAEGNNSESCEWPGEVENDQMNAPTADFMGNLMILFAVSIIAMSLRMFSEFWRDGVASKPLIIGTGIAVFLSITALGPSLYTLKLLPDIKTFLVSGLQIFLLAALGFAVGLYLPGPTEFFHLSEERCASDMTADMYNFGMSVYFALYAWLLKMTIIRMPKPSLLELFVAISVIFSSGCMVRFFERPQSPDGLRIHGDNETIEVIHDNSDYVGVLIVNMCVMLILLLITGISYLLTRVGYEYVSALLRVSVAMILTVILVVLIYMLPPLICDNIYPPPPPTPEPTRPPGLAFLDAIRTGNGPMPPRPTPRTRRIR